MTLPSGGDDLDVFEAQRRIAPRWGQSSSVVFEFQAIAEHFPRATKWLGKLRRDPRDKKDKDSPERVRLFPLDLLANALRRARLEAKYDDGIARLYSAVEHFGG